MTPGRKRGGRARRGTAPAAPSGISQPIVNSLAPLEILQPAQVEQLHAAALHILQNTGVVFRSPEALRLFRQAGARVHGERVYLEADLIESCLQLAPAQYTLHARNPANTVTVGGQQSVVMPGGGPAFVLDLEGVRRPGTLADMENFTRLSALSPEVHIVARKSVEAQDVPVALRHLECWRAALALADKPVQSGFVGGRAEAEDALQMLAAVFGGADSIDGVPVAHCSVSVNSPLLFDAPMLEGLIAFAKLGQPVLIAPFVMAGVSGPATMAGALAQHNAEVLAGISLVQLVRAGTPVLYGSATSNADLLSGAPAIGSPESAISTVVSAQLARHYNVPSRGGGALTDSPVPDSQSGYERMFTLLASVLSGTHYLMHGVGILESYLTMSYAQFAMDLDLLAMVREFVRPFSITPETLALDAIAEVGPGGMFLDVAHTLERFREVHFRPQIAIRQPFEQWQAAGAIDATARARARCRILLANYMEPPMDSAAANRLENFVDARRREILAG